MALIAGRLEVQVDGELVRAAGAFEFTYGDDQHEMIVGHDGPHGVKAMPKFGMVKGKITVTPQTDVRKLNRLTNATVTVTMAGGQGIVLREAASAHDGMVNSEDASMEVEFHGMSAEPLT